MSLFDAQNPWRRDPHFKVKPYIPRAALSQIIPWLDGHEAIILHGPRQAGKTTLLWKIIETLLERQTPPEAIFYFNFDQMETRDLVHSSEALMQFVTGQGAGHKAWIFLDEAQRIKDPGLTIKALTDLPGRPFKIFVSGSSSLELKAKTKESLTGRQVEFEILPLSFEEIVKARHPAMTLPERPADWIEFHRATTGTLQPFLEDALVFGGYPAVVQEPVAEKKQRLLWELYQAYVEKDVKNFLGIENVTAFNRLVKLLVFQHANLVNKAELASSVGADQRTIDHYLKILQETFVAELLTPYHANRRKEIVHAPKIYFHDVGLANAIAQRFEPSETRADRGALVENFVFTELKKNTPSGTQWRFWRTQKGAEVDFVMVRGQTILPFEVKSGPLRKPASSRSLQSFLTAYSPADCVVLNASMIAETQIGKTRVRFLPLTLFLLGARRLLTSLPI